MTNKIQDTTETIEILSKEKPTNVLWEPTVKSEFLGLVKYLNIPDESKTNLTAETQRILGKCVPPSEEKGGKTGLVVGYVQSGKTMSFTAVAALARDNNYPILIVMAGISVPLSRQSAGRLKKDLRLDDGRTDRSWIEFDNPSGQSKEDVIKSIIENWKDLNVPEIDRQTILITVMKNHVHLKNLIKVLTDIDLNRIPVLIIDDEADQASLNTKAKKAGEESTTYSCIMELCRQIPHHTFLQYTATPQAPLLINIIDKLSPDFVEVLTPGPGYVGGKQFFIDHPELICPIPISESTAEETQDPPESLLEALKIFFLGVAAAIYLGEARENKNNRSMLIHPSFHTEPHKQFYQWVSEIKKRWEKTLSESEDDLDRQDLIEEFKLEFEKLDKTVKDLPKFSDVLLNLYRAIRDTRIEKVNTKNTKGVTPTIVWRDSYSWILIGGQAMDRGFTVEGLSVTYMSRGIGVGNADTLQQRARFLGYKEKYIGYCRIYLDQKMKKAFQDYVEHEEDIRKQLKEYSQSGKSLSAWKRAFLMPDLFHPTRRNVLKDSYTRDKLSDSWYTPSIPYGVADYDEENRKIVDHFIESMTPVPDRGNPGRTSTQKHLVDDGLSLKRVYEELLLPFIITDLNTSERYTGLLLQLKKYLEENPNETCSVFIMSRESLDRDWQTRERSVGGELFQGANPDKTGSIYPGDRNLGDRRRVVVELHRLRVLDSNRNVITNDIRAVAVWVPEKMAKSWLVQDQIIETNDKSN